MIDLFSRLIVSAPNDGGLLAIIGGQVYPLDSADTTGLCLTGDTLVRALQPNTLRLYGKGPARDIVLEGDLGDVHDVLEHEGRYYVVGTRGNAVAELSADGAVIRRWAFPGEQDARHINCLAVWDGRIVLSCFGDFDAARGYKAGSRGTGYVQDLLSGEKLIEGLSQPHSITTVGSNLLVANSEKEQILEFGPDRDLIRSRPLGGYTRGIRVAGDIVYVGLSAPRHVEQPLDADAAILALDLRTWEELGRLPLPTREVYSIAQPDSADALAIWVARVAADNALRRRAAEQPDALLAGTAPAVTETTPSGLVAVDRAQAAEAEVTRLQIRVADLQFERDKAHEAVVAVRRSASWRLATPVRAAAYVARGDFGSVRRGTRHAVTTLASKLPAPVRSFLKTANQHSFGRLRRLGNSAANHRAVQDIVDARCAYRTPDGMPGELPPIDISAVVFNDARWLRPFAASVMALDYPRHLMRLIFVDNGSTDGSAELIETVADSCRAAGIRVSTLHRSNAGFGAGHNTGIAAGDAAFVLVTNVDVEFEPDAFTVVVKTAIADAPDVAAWELRQLPFEHPKYYDPVTGLTNWNSHACVLLRRSAMAEVGGYDESIFMYGEDVEISYRLRRAGYQLKYVPRATLTHHSFTSVEDIKPLQFSGSTLSNFYLRLKYGRVGDMLAAPLLLGGLALSLRLPAPLRGKVRANVAKAPATAWRGLTSRRPSTAAFPFRRWDYDMVRDGADVTSKMVRNPALVSVITRTVKGREALLRQAIQSVANQTYGAIEHIVVQDGGSVDPAALDPLAMRDGYNLRLLGLPKSGRSAAGNAGLQAATGRWCVFLDDDDLMFGEHLEVLVGAVTEAHSRAAYSLAWEVPTAFKTAGDGTSYVEASHLLPDALRQEFDHKVLQHHNFLPIQAVLFERSLFTERGGFEEDMDALEDWVLWNKYAVGNDFAYVKKTTSMYRVPASAEAATRRVEVLTRAYPVAVSRIALNRRHVLQVDREAGAGLP